MDNLDHFGHDCSFVQRDARRGNWVGLEDLSQSNLIDHQSLTQGHPWVIVRNHPMLCMRRER